MNRIRAFLIAVLLCPVWALALALALEPAPTPGVLFDAPLADLAKQPTTLARFRGQPLIINFWARWCGPCQAEIPDIVAEYARAKASGVQLVGIALDDKSEAVRDFMKAYDMEYPVLMMTQEQGFELLKQLGNSQAGLPFTLVIDRAGNIVTRKLGIMSRTEWASAFNTGK